MLIVSKFGGSVTASAEGIKRAMKIVRSDSSRRYVIASAPGKTFSGTGITDMLFMCHSSFSRHENYHELLEKISDNYRAIIDGLGISFDIDAEISALNQDLSSGKNLDYIGSRGEYLTYSPCLKAGDSGINKPCLIAQVLRVLLHWPMPQPYILCFIYCNRLADFTPAQPTRELYYIAPYIPIAKARGFTASFDNRKNPCVIFGVGICRCFINNILQRRRNTERVKNFQHSTGKTLTTRTRSNPQFLRLIA